MFVPKTDTLKIRGIRSTYKNIYQIVHFIVNFDKKKFF